MPYPKNLEMARLVEKTVRDNGAVPATIAVIDGVIKVGLSQVELEAFANPSQKMLKVSRRDLPFITAHKSSGGTTVAATMIAANLVGRYICIAIGY